MTINPNIRLSVIDQSPIRAGATARQALLETVELAAPLASVALFVLCADTEAKAAELRAALDLMLLRCGKGERGPVPTATEVRRYRFTPDDQLHLAHNQGRVVSGTSAQVQAQLTKIAEEYAVDEVSAVTITPDFRDRRRSYELLADVFALAPVGAEPVAALA